MRLCTHTHTHCEIAFIPFEKSNQTTSTDEVAVVVLYVGLFLWEVAKLFMMSNAILID